MGIRKEINDVIKARGGKPPVNGGIAASIDALSKLPPSWNDLTDKPFYKSEETILDGTFEFEGKNGLYTHIFADENFSLVDGKSYTVVWDGEAYQCVATTIEGVTAIGNTGILGQADTGEPFYAAIVGENRVIGTLDTAANHTVKVSTETIKTLDPKYLPQGVGGGVFHVVITNTYCPEIDDVVTTVNKSFNEVVSAIQSGQFVVCNEVEVEDGEIGYVSPYLIGQLNYDGYEVDGEYIEKPRVLFSAMSKNGVEYFPVGKWLYDDGHIERASDYDFASGRIYVNNNFFMVDTRTGDKYRVAISNGQLVVTKI